MAKHKGDPIEIRQKASGKKAYIAGTRVRVADIAVYYGIFLDELVIERLQRAMPHLTAKEIADAIEYWRNNKDEIQKEIEEDDAAIANIPAAW